MVVKGKVCMQILLSMQNSVFFLEVQLNLTEALLQSSLSDGPLDLSEEVKVVGLYLVFFI